MSNAPYVAERLTMTWRQFKRHTSSSPHTQPHLYGAQQVRVADGNFTTLRIPTPRADLTPPLTLSIIVGAQLQVSFCTAYTVRISDWSYFDQQKFRHIW